MGKTPTPSPLLDYRPKRQQKSPFPCWSSFSGCSDGECLLPSSSRGGGGGWSQTLFPNRRIPPVLQCSSAPASQHHRYCHGPPTLSHPTEGFENIGTHNEAAAAPIRLPAPSAEFAQLSHLFFQIIFIKLCHHLDNVAPADGDKAPFLIQSMMHQLFMMLRPAFTDSTVHSAPQRNARQWGSSTLKILDKAQRSSSFSPNPPPHPLTHIL